MKISSLSKLVGAGAIAASLAVVPLTLPAQAQTQNNTTDTTQQTGTTTQQTGDVAAADTDNDFDWGWLGLLGLPGLLGLAGLKRQENVHHDNNPNVTVRSGSDYR
jgi:hypothetical protein